MVRWPDIILVNGASSSGKSTLCKALQKTFVHPYLHFSFDDLIFMSPKRYYGSSDTHTQTEDNEFIEQGVKLVTSSAPGAPLEVEAVFGPVFQKIIKAMPDVVKTLVKNGNSVIFDHVIHDEEMALDLERCFTGLKVLKIGVYCPPEILEEREKQRGDRVLGRARGLLGVVHKYMEYDLKVDTSATKTVEAVQEIESHIKTD